MMILLRPRSFQKFLMKMCIKRTFSNKTSRYLFPLTKKQNGLTRRPGMLLKSYIRAAENTQEKVRKCSDFYINETDEYTYPNEVENKLKKLDFQTNFGIHSNRNSLGSGIKK